MRVSRLPFSLFLCLFVLQTNAFAETRFTVEDILDWKIKSFEGETRYQLDDSTKGGTMIEAISEASASGLFLESKIDLEKTPWINWRWKVEQFPTIGDEKVKQGDDFAARIYIVVQDGWTSLSSRAISYVWSQQYAVGEEWANPYTGKRAMMLSVESSTETGILKTQKRNVRDDLKRLFGKDYSKIKAVAIMTDTDSSTSRAKSYYSDIVFTAE